MIASDTMDDWCDLLSGAHYCLNWREKERRMQIHLFLGSHKQDAEPGGHLVSEQKTTPIIFNYGTHSLNVQKKTTPIILNNEKHRLNVLKKTTPIILNYGIHPLNVPVLIFGGIPQLKFALVYI